MVRWNKRGATLWIVWMGLAALQGECQQAGPTTPTVSELPQAPVPNPTVPADLRDTPQDYTKPKTSIFHWKTPSLLFLPFTATNYPQARLVNTPQFAKLLQDGKIGLSLSDAILLALENNYDIAIARINLDIADTDILRAKAGSTLRGVSTGLVENTLGGTTSTVTGGGGPGGTSSSAGGSGTGASGLVLSTNGGGPAPENLDPSLNSSLEFEAVTTPATSLTSNGANALVQRNTTLDFGYSQGFLSGTLLSATFNNLRDSTNSINQIYSPQLQSNFRVTATQHLLQGFGKWLNGRFILQARNDRQITDSAFRQQILYTVNQVENIYWGLVSAYEDEQAKERALDQSTRLSADNRKQFELGLLAPLDVVNADSSVIADKQALIASKSNLEYQQLIIKQAIARDLDDTALAEAVIIPTDRVDLSRTPEEDLPVDQLVRQAYANNPQIEQAVLNMKNNEITVRAEKNGLLPVLDVYAFYGASAIGGAQNGVLNCGTSSVPAGCTSGLYPGSGYASTLGHLFNNSSPDAGAGVNLTIPLRNRTAQADQARSQMEFRQTQMRLQQLYTQVRIRVTNGQYALTNDRAQVAAAQAARDYAAQSVEAEKAKFRLGASTSVNVLLQARLLAIAENNVISATAAYAKDRAALEQLLSNTLDRYGIRLQDAANGVLPLPPVVPGLATPSAPAPPKPLTHTLPPPPSL